MSAHSPLVAWETVFNDTPRDPYIPDIVWVEGERIDRRTDPEGWTRAVRADIPLVTQMDDGVEGGDLIPTSSASMPSLVRYMLEQLDARPDHDVLELGTGTGWTTALLATALTKGIVTTVEVDTVVAIAARRALTGRSYATPTTVIGDGLEGYEPGAPYDLVLSTMAVRHIPYAWVEQSAPGGVILTPWGTAYNNSGLLRLVVDRDGTASGRFVGNAAFMYARSQRRAFDGRRFVGDVIKDPSKGRSRHTTTDPRRLREEHADFAIGLAVPDVEQRVFFGSGESAGESTSWYTDGESWASVDHVPGADSFRVTEGGPCDLWASIEGAYRAWRARGEPPREQHGITVTPDGQWAWHDGPRGRTDCGPMSR
ncbi:hypothetical protein [Embleya sp. NPDC050493]|uniref:hypothetical protein n=1 Tax=Embleya sp. NPDC050493 TaxID=3363989 RepID=UPI0037A9D6C5